MRLFLEPPDIGRPYAVAADAPVAPPSSRAARGVGRISVGIAERIEGAVRTRTKFDWGTARVALAGILGALIGFGGQGSGPLASSALMAASCVVLVGYEQIWGRHDGV